MAIRLVNPENSFVKFNAVEDFIHCSFGLVSFCLPIFLEDDVAFQFILEADSEAEADTLCDIGNTLISLGLVNNCDDADFLLEFTQKPVRYRISTTQVLYNWMAGVPGFQTVIDINKCFHIRVKLGEDIWCGPCMERISDDCYTNVIEFSNEENAYGYNYCNGLSIGDTDSPGNCEPTVFSFGPLVSTLSIPYTAELLAKHGDVPTVRVWIYNEDGVLQNMGTVVSFDSVPPTTLEFDFGGPATGVIVIK